MPRADSTTRKSTAAASSSCAPSSSGQLKSSASVVGAKGLKSTSQTRCRRSTYTSNTSASSRRSPTPHVARIGSIRFDSHATPADPPRTVLFGKIGSHFAPKELADGLAETLAQLEQERIEVGVVSLRDGYAEYIDPIDLRACVLPRRRAAVC